MLLYLDEISSHELIFLVFSPWKEGHVACHSRPLGIACRSHRVEQTLNSCNGRENVCIEFDSSLLWMPVVRYIISRRYQNVLCLGDMLSHVRSRVENDINTPMKRVFSPPHAFDVGVFPCHQYSSRQYILSFKIFTCFERKLATASVSILSSRVVNLFSNRSFLDITTFLFDRNKVYFSQRLVNIFCQTSATMSDADQVLSVRNRKQDFILFSHTSSHGKAEFPPILECDVVVTAKPICIIK